jgi:hypothetical protein
MSCHSAQNSVKGSVALPASPLGIGLELLAMGGGFRKPAVDPGVAEDDPEMNLAHHPVHYMEPPGPPGTHRAQRLDHQHCGIAGAGWGLLAVVFAAMLPMLVVKHGVRCGRLTDRHLGDRRQRLPVMVFAIGCVAVSLARECPPLIL